MVKPNSLSAKPGKKAKPASARSVARRPAVPKTAPIGPETGETEKRILAAARKEFVVKGLEGARMQVIATGAGVNKALLHYYYRSKENLYGKVLEDTVATVWGKLQSEFRARSSPARPQGDGVEGIVQTIVSTYIRTLSANPDFPLFIFREMARGGATFTVVLNELLKNFGDVPATLIKALEEEARAGRIRPVHPLHFIMNMMGMTVTTFLAMPLLQRMGPAMGHKIKFDEAFLEERIRSITDTLLNGIRIKR